MTNTRVHKWVYTGRQIKRYYTGYDNPATLDVWECIYCGESRESVLGGKPFFTSECPSESRTSSLESRT